MELLNFPGCCTARVLVGFGGTDMASYHRFSKGDDSDEQMFKEIMEHLLTAHRTGMAIVFATTNSQQEQANRVLPQAGFKKTDTAAKENHQEFTLTGWVYTLNPEEKVVPLQVPANPFVKPEPVVEVPAPVVGPYYWEHFQAVGVADKITGSRHENFKRICGFDTRTNRPTYAVAPECIGVHQPLGLNQDRRIRVRIAGRDDWEAGDRAVKECTWVVYERHRSNIAITHYEFV